MVTARERFSTALERDYFMTAQEAVEFGIVDKIVQKRTDTQSDAKTA